MSRRFLFLQTTLVKFVKDIILFHTYRDALLSYHNLIYNPL